MADGQPPNEPRGGPSPGDPSPTDPVQAEVPRRLLETYCASWNAWDLDRLFRLFHARATYRGQRPGGDRRGRDSIREMYEQSRDQAGHLKAEVVVLPDEVYAVGLWRRDRGVRRPAGLVRFKIGGGRIVKHDFRGDDPRGRQHAVSGGGGVAHDVAFCSYGAVVWLSDIDAWARGVAATAAAGRRPTMCRRCR